MAMLWPFIRTGKDENGWNTIDFAAAQVGQYRKVQVNRWGRNLEIVLQDKPMRVHVNPKVCGFDLWENPIGSGKGMWIGSPLEHPAPTVRKRPAGCEKESADANAAAQAEVSSDPALPDDRKRQKLQPCVGEPEEKVDP